MKPKAIRTCGFHIGIAVLSSMAILGSPLRAQKVRNGAVETITIRATNMPAAKQYQGRLRPVRRFVISFEVPGRINGIRIQVGDLVRKGDALLQLDPRSFELQQEKTLAQLKVATAERKVAQSEVATAKAPLQAAIAQRDFARRALDRLMRLFKKNAVERPKLDRGEADLKKALAGVTEAEGQVATAQAKFEAATARVGVVNAEIRAIEHNLQATKLWAPISGRVSKIHVARGSFVRAGTPAVQISDESSFIVPVAVSDVEALKLPGAKAVVEVPAVKGKFSGIVTSLYAAREESRRGDFTALVKVSPAGQTKLRSGLTTRLTFSVLTSTRRPTTPKLIIPVSAVFPDAGGKKFVWLVDSGKVQAHEIVVARFDEDLVEILDGLKAGQVIVVRGVAFLKNGSKIDDP